ncbi:arrestin domain-containing protein 3-like [Lucilia cuprina]|uniref:arrestin domain-containing protein 3-like n=1 Tax=Lucilia cuprina TaxID=7375 RepID=UPI001F05A970|nr:arrestin domain-containing protein 3-like [Lucilia cuprina]
MPSTCRFDLNKPSAIYFSGETIAGTITLSTTSDKNVRDVSIIFLGEGKVKWEESHSTTNSDGSSSTSTTYYKSHEVYVNNSTMVHGDGILPAGTYTYTFNIPLPWECPTSCEGKYGHIRYEISLKINRYYRFDNIYKRPVTIIKTIDLNLNPAYKIPMVLETISKLCCWPCSKGKIFCTLQIPYGAYAPGQNIKYALHIMNQSMSDTQGYSIEFTKKMIFTAKSPHRKERTSKNTLVSRTFSEQCLRLTNRIIEGEMYIPATPPTTPRSSIICVEYKLKVTLHLPGCTSNAVMEMPIVIGTIPLRESLPADDSLMNVRMESVMPTAPELAGAELNSVDADLPPSYNDIKPPSFEEATRSNSPFIDTDVDARNRIVGFRPLYPMYNMPYNGK